MTIRKYYLLLLSALIILGSCQKKHNWNFTVQGTLLNAPARTYARLYKAEPTGNIFQDSAEVDKNGHFILHGKTTGKDFFIVNFTNADYNIYLVVDSADNITLRADYNGLLSSYQVEGSNESDLIRQLEQHLDSTKKKIQQLTITYRNMLEKGLRDSARKTDSLIKETLRAQKRFSSHFVYKHYNSLVALPALSQVYVPGQPIFDPEQDADLFFMVDSALGRQYPKNPHVLRMHSFVQNIKLSLQRKQSFGSYIVPGQKAPDFTANTSKHQRIELKNFKGKYVYLIFTASWCQQCTDIMNKRENLNPNKVVKIAFSLDIDSASLAELEKKYGNSYIILNDHRFWNSPIVRKYNVSQLPTEFLISPDGKILGINTQVKDQINKLGL